MTLLAVANLSVAYGAVRAVEDVTLTVGRGEIVLLLGPNGAGKSTIVRTISGLNRPSAGSVTFDGARIDRLAPHQIVARGIAQVAEGKRLFPELTVEENLDLGAFVHRRDRAGIARDRDLAYARFPILAEKRRDPAATLSGGQQQMLALAQALMSRPRLLMLDEPSLGLAPLIVAEIFAIVRQVAAEGCTILLVEQMAAQALRIADRGYVLSTGRVVMEGTGAALRADPALGDVYFGSV